MALRVASLLPSATETLLALGATPCAVSHSCDFPEVANVPVVTSTVIDPDLSAAQIDRQVSSVTGPLYHLDVNRLHQLRPDIVVTQTVCRVCAIDGRDLNVDSLPGHLVTMDESSFSTLPNDFLLLGQAVGLEEEAEALAADWNKRLNRLPPPPATKPRIAFLEWLDPPFSPGHWVPEMIELAGGTDVLGRVGDAARRLTWQEVEESNADIVIAGPCGFSPEEVNDLAGPDMLPVAARFDRPGPGLIDALEWLSEVVQSWAMDKSRRREM